MSGGRDHVGIGHRRGVHARRDQAAYVRHVHEHVRAALVADLADALPVYDARVGAGAGDYHLGLELKRLAAQLVIVYKLAVLVHAVGADVKILAGYRGLGAVGQVSAAAQVHAHEHVAGLAQREVDGHVRLAARVGLDVGVLGAEQLARAPAGDVLHDVHVLAAAVIALAGVALGVLVGEIAAHGLHDRRRGEVLAGYQLNVVALAPQLLLHDGIYLGIGKAKVCKIHCPVPQMSIFLSHRRTPVQWHYNICRRFRQTQ